MAFFPLNVFLAVFFLAGVFWGWEGELMRRLFAVISAVFMLPLWTVPLVVQTESANNVLIQQIPNWLPTTLLGNLLFWNVVLMYWTTAHVFEYVSRDPIGRFRNADGSKSFRRKR